MIDLDRKRGRRTNGLFHGECVALGMLPMIEDKSLVRRTRALYRTLGLPTRTGVDKNKVLSYMQHDKKSTGSTITVIKVPGLGCWRADKIPMTELPANPHTSAASPCRVSSRAPITSSTVRLSSAMVTPSGTPRNARPAAPIPSSRNPAAA